MSSHAYARTDPVNYHSMMLSKEEYYELLDERPCAAHETSYDHRDDKIVSTVVFSRLTAADEAEPDDWEDGRCEACDERITWDGDLAGFIMYRKDGPEWICEPCRTEQAEAEVAEMEAAYE